MDYYVEAIGAKIVQSMPFTQEIMQQAAPDKTFSDEELSNSVMHAEMIFGGSPIYIACGREEQNHNDQFKSF